MNFIKLHFKLDLEKLRADLETVEKTWKHWNRSVYIKNGVRFKGIPNWKLISLRAQTGKPEQVDTGEPGLMPYEDTKILEKALYFKKILRRLGQLSTELHSARLSSLPPGARIPVHCDDLMGFQLGQLRLHIPIVTEPGADFTIDGEKLHMTPGALWYGDVSKSHSVCNSTSKTRIHLIIDVPITKKILKLFPDKMIKTIGIDNILINKKKYHINKSDLKNYECNFLFSCGLSLINGDFDKKHPQIFDQMASIRLVKNQLVLSLEGKDLAVLHPVSKTEFYFAGGVATTVLKFKIKNKQVTQISLVLNKGRLKTILQMPLIKKNQCWTLEKGLFSKASLK